MPAETRKRDITEKVFRLRVSFLWALLLSVTMIITIILYPNLLTKKYSYHIGDIAERDIKAPIDFLIKDTEATEANRRMVADAVYVVYDHDTMVAEQLNKKLHKAFSTLRAVIESKRKSDAAAAATETTEADDKKAVDKVSLHELIWQKKDEFQSTMGIRISDDAYSILEKEGFAEKIEKLISDVLNKIMDNGVVANKEILLREEDKGIVLRKVGTQTEKVVHNLKRYYGPDQAKAMVRIIGQPILKDVNYNLTNLIVDFCQRMIHPNIFENRNETQLRREKAAQEVKLILHEVKAGEMLLREGERVTKDQLLKLRELQANTKKEHMVTNSIGTALIIFCLLFLTYILYSKNDTSNADDENRNLLFVASLLIVFCFIAKISAFFAQFLTFPISSSFVYGIPLAAGGMTVCLFMGIHLAIPLAMILAICASLIFHSRFDLFIYFFLGGAMAAYWIQECRERQVFIKAGAKIGLLNVILVTALDIYNMGDVLGLTSIWDWNFGFKLIWDWAFAFSAGIMTGIITHGVVPLIEVTFDYSTNIKLLELANLDRPILKRLMLEAPGTYHHSVIVGSMVEAAASSIGANPLLGRVCGYYHDIGKINKPLYFIENQRDGRNRHDKLAPSMSSLILISHIKEGVEIAKENKLGRSITDTIQQHHGTSLISYFYEKAKKLKGEDAVKIDDYRYPGPKPQTREAGLVMLADVIEAASRTLENPTPARIQGHVQKFINKIFSDGQLDNCELTLKDLHNIAKSFNKILNGIYHHRIEYSENTAAAANIEKGKNGNSDRQPAKPSPVRPAAGNEDRASHLKRLGQS